MFEKLNEGYSLLKEIKDLSFESIVKFVKEGKFYREVIYAVITRDVMEDSGSNRVLHYYWYSWMISEVLREQKCDMCRKKSLLVLRNHFNENKYNFKDLSIEETKNIPIIKIKELRCNRCNPPFREFKINKFITLKLENKKTNIYVNEEKFNQCKYLAVNINLNETEKYDDISSIDDLEKVDRSSLFRECNIDPETEFWGHCSNLQVWVENDYDSRLLHSNLSFPLLKKLYYLGDPIAKKVFKDEIANRFNDGDDKIKKLLISEDYINSKLFTFEELKILFNFDFKNIGSKKYDIVFRMINGNIPLSFEDIEYIIQHSIDYSMVNDYLYIILNTAKKISETNCFSCKRIRIRKFRMVYNKIIPTYRHLIETYTTDRSKEILLFNFDVVACKNHTIY